MPSERRLIRFSLEEVHLALRMFAGRINLKISESRLLSIHTAPSGGSNNLLCFEDKGENQVISDNRLATCLMAFCIKHKIPLPRDAAKSLHLSEDCVDIRITLPMHGVPALEETEEEEDDEGREVVSVEI